MTPTDNSSLIAFICYTAVVLALAVISNYAFKKRSFLSEYFLGSRGLGVIALALTFGATSASAGSFAGFPSLIYAHGWSLALWIASYMIFPICSMGILGKRLSVISQRTGAITVPDILRERFESRTLALLSTSLMAILLCVYLVPQFTLAALIMQQLLGSSPIYQELAIQLQTVLPELIPQTANPEYVFGLLLFALLVVVYTTFGGFRAVVWTDILQGFVMVIGVLLMLIFAIIQVGGLPNASSAMSSMQPPRLGTASFNLDMPAPPNGIRIDSETWFMLGDDLYRTNEAVHILEGTQESASVKVTQIMTPFEIDRITADGVAELPATAVIHELTPYARGDGQSGTYMKPPGPSPSDPNGFLPLGLAVSFFAFWALAGTGQPSNMVRLMAFTGTRTLRRAIASLVTYFLMIYFPLVIIFCCARLLAPGLDHTPDRIMPVMAYILSEGAGVPWLAGILIAAPFAAAMSTVDSFILMISSSVVRDVYQQSIHPCASQRSLKWISYGTTLLIGLIATFGALYPPQFLQYIIVFTGGGLAVAFLAPVALGIYWPRFNKSGAIMSMGLGIIVYALLYLIGFIILNDITPVRPLGLDPLIWGFLASLIGGWIGTYLTGSNSEEVLEKFFGKPLPTQDIS
ncbi:MAG: hypothetical protein OXF08_06485 [Bacteroidetes bacterium]|nr:hypothetical protein [Bacteroidota bacterium]